MIVWSLAVPANELVVVSPVNVIALVITRGLVQLAFPAGMITVSPSTAEPMALLTSKKEGVRAVMLFACAAPEAAKSAAASIALRAGAALSARVLGFVRLRDRARCIPGVKHHSCPRISFASPLLSYTSPRLSSGGTTTTTFQPWL